MGVAYNRISIRDRLVSPCGDRARGAGHEGREIGKLRLRDWSRGRPRAIQRSRAEIVSEFTRSLAPLSGLQKKCGRPIVRPSEMMARVSQVPNSNAVVPD